VLSAGNPAPRESRKRRGHMGHAAYLVPARARGLETDVHGALRATEAAR